MVIREAKLDDIQILFDLRRDAEEDLRAGDATEEIEMAKCKADVSSGRGSCLVYEVGNKIAGFIYAQHVDENDQATGRIRYLYVVPQHRGAAGAHLYEQCERRLVEKGYSSIIFGTTPENFMIKEMGQRYGFHSIGRRGPLDFYAKALR